MMTGHGDQFGAVGGPARHVPVLLEEVLAALQPLAGARIVDGTFGAGGYTRALLAAGAQVVAIDRDPDAVASGRALEVEAAGRLQLFHATFSELDQHAGAVDGVVLDIGVSSMQLDQAERGFSFRADGPLDMRMERSGPTAADVINRGKAGDLTRIFGLLGEERHAGRIARMIERRAAERPFLRTRDLAESIEQLVGRKPGDKIHPATRVFQALRVYVNDELGELARGLELPPSEPWRRPAGWRSSPSTRWKIAWSSASLPIARQRPQAPATCLKEKAVTATFEKPARAVAPSDAEVETNPTRPLRAAALCHSHRRARPRHRSVRLRTSETAWHSSGEREVSLVSHQ